jgi:hypothetical protein
MNTQCVVHDDDRRNADIGGDEFLARIFAGAEGSVVIAKPTQDKGYFQRSWCWGDAATLAPGAWYWCCSTSKAAAKVNRDGVTTINRRKSDLARTCALVLDDIGTKVETVRVEQMLPPPSAIVETSPGNFQWVYILDGGADPQEAATALERLAAAEVTDAGAKDASHVFRLPGSINDKAAVLERNGGQPWSARVTLWAPERRYILDKIVERVPRNAGPKARRKADADRQHYKSNGVHGLDILQRFNMVLGQGSNGGVNIRCPWSGEHSGETSDSATTYWPPKSGKKPGFKCMHGHCDGRGIKDLHVWLRAMDPTFKPRPPNGNDKPAVGKAADQPGDAGKERGPKQADVLIALADEATLFHTADGTAFADLTVGTHRETWPIQRKDFRRWLKHRFFKKTGSAPNAEALQAALGIIEARAQFDADAPECGVYIRIGEHGGKIYLDLGDAEWRAVEIATTGWRIVDKPPLRFRRAAGVKPLPDPQRGGSIKTLRRFLNVASDRDFRLAVAWLLAALRGRGPYPVLALEGEQGTGKSLFVAILRSLADPNTAALRSLVREERDLFIAATNSHVIAFDNVSGMPAWLSDALCRIATGAAFAARQLFTDQDEMLLDACRPIILNGIADIVGRSDLADRTIFLSLEPFAEGGRRTEAELWSEFEKERPAILGVLLDAVAEGLKRLPDTRLEKLPRMADFALWATACHAALWETGNTFMEDYGANIAGAVDAVIDADPVGDAIRTMMTAKKKQEGGEQPKWGGTAAELLIDLGKQAGERIAKSRSWPETARALAGRLRRAAPGLRKIGIEIGFGRKARTRTISITGAPTRSEEEGEFASSPSLPSSALPKSKPINDLATPDPMTQNPMMTQTPSSQIFASSQKTCENGHDDGDDANDAKSRIPSKPRVERRL